MTKSAFFFFFFLNFTLTLLLAVSPATASTGNVTSELRYDGCAPGDTIGECITAMVEEEEKEEVDAMVVRRIMQQAGGNHIANGAVERERPGYKGNSAAKFIGGVNSQGATCTPYQRCKVDGMATD